ncbi:hypothetical protein KIPB_015754, partial [Kipferlia bialata]
VDELYKWIGDSEDITSFRGRFIVFARTLGSVAFPVEVQACNFSTLNSLALDTSTTTGSASVLDSLPIHLAHQPTMVLGGVPHNVSILSHAVIRISQWLSAAVTQDLTPEALTLLDSGGLPSSSLEPVSEKDIQRLLFLRARLPLVTDDE